MENGKVMCSQNCKLSFDYSLWLGITAALVKVEAIISLWHGNDTAISI